MKLPQTLRSFSGIRDLPLYIVASQGIVAVANYLSPGLINYLSLSPSALYAGELWRCMTFLFVPPPFSPLFLILWLYTLHSYAHALENVWGSARFTVYYGVGALATLAVGFWPGPGVVPTTYLNASLFLAFAALFAHTEVLLFFVIPVKVRYLGWLVWGWLALVFWESGATLTRLAILAALTNYVLLLGPELWEKINLWIHRWRNR
jgi:hypothetical protein